MLSLDTQSKEYGKTEIFKQYFLHLIPRAFESRLVTKATKLQCYSWQFSTAKCLIVSESYDA